MIGRRIAARLPAAASASFAKEDPELLDALRARLVQAGKTAAATKERDAVMPERKAVKVRRRLKNMGKVSSSPAMETALTAMAALPTDLPPAIPAEAATEVWQALQSRKVCVKGCRAFCKGFVGASNNFAYHQPARSGGPSRAAGVDSKRRGDDLMSPEEVVHSRCCAADCTPTLSTEGVQAIRDKWFSLPPAKRFHYLVELVWDDAVGKPKPACDDRLHQILGVGGTSSLASGGLLAQARAQAAEHGSAEVVPREHGMKAHAAAHPLANANSPATTSKVEQHFKACSYVSPEVITTLTGPPKKYRHCSFSDAGNMQALAKNYNEHAPTEHRVAIGVYQRITKVSARVRVRVGIRVRVRVRVRARVRAKVRVRVRVPLLP